MTAPGTLCRGITGQKKSKTAADFLNHAIDWFDEKFDVQFEELLSKNGKEYTDHIKSERKKHSFKKRWKKSEIKHKRTEVVNRKVERSFKTLADELHNKYNFDSQKDREMALKKYLKQFREHRTHFGINGLTPREKSGKGRSAETKTEEDDVRVKIRKPLPMC